jgi:16S rRNA (cytosine967-C5)-methyltransferase
VERELEDQGIRLEPGAVLTAARRVIGGDVTATAGFRESRVRVQEEGSQLIAELTGHGARILDCCAAPGGKTLVLAECNPLVEITACEVSPARAEALRRRIAESAWGARIQVMEADAAELPAVPGYDLVLADVPCSGTGTLGRNPEIRHRLRVEDLARHHERQCAILRGALRAGEGRVLYSTCSMEPEENQDVVAEVLAGSPEWRRVSVEESIRELAAEGRVAESAVDALLRCVNARGELLLLPGAFGTAVATDGFFAAMLERAG